MYGEEPYPTDDPRLLGNDEANLSLLEALAAQDIGGPSAAFDLLMKKTGWLFTDEAAAEGEGLVGARGTDAAVGAIAVLYEMATGDLRYTSQTDHAYSGKKLARERLGLSANELDYLCTALAKVTETPAMNSGLKPYIGNVRKLSERFETLRQAARKT